MPPLGGTASPASPSDCRGFSPWPSPRPRVASTTLAPISSRAAWRCPSSRTSSSRPAPQGESRAGDRLERSSTRRASSCPWKAMPSPHWWRKISPSSSRRRTTSRRAPPARTTSPRAVTPHHQTARSAPRIPGAEESAEADSLLGPGARWTAMALRLHEAREDDDAPVRVRLELARDLQKDSTGTSSIESVHEPDRAAATRRRGRGARQRADAEGEHEAATRRHGRGRPAATLVERDPAEEIPLEVLHEDDDLIVLNKQPDIIVHPRGR